MPTTGSDSVFDLSNLGHGLLDFHASLRLLLLRLTRRKGGFGVRLSQRCIKLEVTLVSADDAEGLVAL